MEKNNFLTRFTSIYTDKTINPYIRGFAWVATAGVIFVVGKGVLNLFKKPSADQQAAADAANDVQKLSQTMQPSYSDSAYDDYANEIYDNSKHGDQLQSAPVEDTLKLMNNQLDVAKLIKAFGTRPYYSYFNWLEVSPQTYFGLLGAASNTFNNDYFGAFFWRKGSVNDDWKSKGITYQIP